VPHSIERPQRFSSVEYGDAEVAGTDAARLRERRQRGEEERRHETEAELAGRQAALKRVIDRLEDLVTDRKIPEDVITLLRTRNESRQQILPSDLGDGLARLRLSAEIKRDLIDAERDFIYQLLRDGKITDEARRRIEYELDLEEASVANRGRDGGGWF